MEIPVTATNFQDLLNPAEHFKASDGMWSTRILDADEILARPVPWVDCPTCDALGWVGGPTGATLVVADTCPTCSGTGKATVAQLLAWGQAIADPIDSHGLSGDDDYEAVVWYRNRILDVQP